MGKRAGSNSFSRSGTADRSGPSSGYSTPARASPSAAFQAPAKLPSSTPCSKISTKKAYQPVLLPYAGHSRNGIARILAEALGVDAKGRGIPLIARTQQYIVAMIDGANPRYPVIIIDGTQRLENDSLWDLSSLLFQTGKPSSAASLLLVGDETLVRRLDLHILSPIRSRLTAIIKTQYLNEYESRLFIEHRLTNAAAPQNLFENDAVEIIAASTRGNRRALLHIATMDLEEAYYHEQKTITAEILYNSEGFNKSE